MLNQESPPDEPAPAYWTVDEVAKKLQLDVRIVRRIFRNEPGVLKLGQKTFLHGRRPHVTLRIPDALLQQKIRDWKKSDEEIEADWEAWKAKLKQVHHEEDMPLLRRFEEMLPGKRKLKRANRGEPE